MQFTSEVRHKRENLFFLIIFMTISMAKGPSHGLAKWLNVLWYLFIIYLQLPKFMFLYNFSLSLTMLRNYSICYRNNYVMLLLLLIYAINNYFICWPIKALLINTITLKKRYQFLVIIQLIFQLEFR